MIFQAASNGRRIIQGLTAEGEARELEDLPNRGNGRGVGDGRAIEGACRHVSGGKDECWAGEALRNDFEAGVDEIFVGIDLCA